MDAGAQGATGRPCARYLTAAMRGAVRPLLGLLVGGGLLLLLEGGLRAAGVAGAGEGQFFSVTTNGDGLRTRLARPRTPGVSRVALMGDSTVFGWGVDDGGTLADGTQAALDGVGVLVEVLNAGQPGYSTTQAAWLFGEVVQAYRPDRVVLFLSRHDYDYVPVSDREALSGGDGFASRVRVRLASSSRTYQLLRGLLWSRTDAPALHPRDVTGEPRVPRVGDAERACCVGEAAARVLPDDPGHLSAEGHQVVGAAVAAALR